LLNNKKTSHFNLNRKSILKNIKRRVSMYKGEGDSIRMLNVLNKTIKDLD